MGGPGLPAQGVIPFTPTIMPATVGDWSVSYTVQNGLMITQGSLAWLDLAMTFVPTFTAAATGQLRILGLPMLPVTGLSNLQFQDPTSNITWPSSSTMMMARPLADLSGLGIFGLRSAGTAAALAAANLATGGTTRINLAGWIRIG